MPLQWGNQIWQSLEEGAGKRCSECDARTNAHTRTHSCSRTHARTHARTHTHQTISALILTTTTTTNQQQHKHSTSDRTSSSKIIRSFRIRTDRTTKLKHAVGNVCTFSPLSGRQLLAPLSTVQQTMPNNS